MCICGKKLSGNYYSYKTVCIRICLHMFLVIPVSDLSLPGQWGSSSLLNCLVCGPILLLRSAVHVHALVGILVVVVWGLHVPAKALEVSLCVVLTVEVLPLAAVPVELHVSVVLALVLAGVHGDPASSPSCFVERCDPCFFQRRVTGEILKAAKKQGTGMVLVLKVPEPEKAPSWYQTLFYQREWLDETRDGWRGEEGLECRFDWCAECLCDLGDIVRLCFFHDEDRPE
nr:hypothetical protein BaRGS_025800 [Batillaria attramentaria]